MSDRQIHVGMEKEDIPIVISATFHPFFDVWWCICEDRVVGRQRVTIEDGLVSLIEKSGSLQSDFTWLMQKSEEVDKYIFRSK